jgi:hypothetical protein
MTGLVSPARCRKETTPAGHTGAATLLRFTPGWLGDSPGSKRVDSVRLLLFRKRRR